MRLLGDQDPHVVGADEAGFDREQVDTGAPVGLDAQVAGLEVQGALDRRREGGSSEGPGVDTEQEVVHGRVSHDRHLEDVGRGEAA